MITRTGLLEANEVREYNVLPRFDTTIYTESDGSKWIHVFHHNNPGSSGDKRYKKVRVYGQAKDNFKCH